ncbi:MAG: hypothetical protein GX461_02780 [Clostridiales bacterium]|nr:hypothetical protein [Clostridiales bacterium]
MASGLYLIYKA